MANEKQPWATGPHEILHHALDLLNDDSDTNRRLAMILIDNAVEQMIKTYLNLPKRITQLTITRARRDEIAESFPKMLDALEEFAADKLGGVDLGIIEWHHRQRNQLYHEGFGLTVSRDSVDVYAALANSLFQNLFGVSLEEPGVQKEMPLNEFIRLWSIIESGVTEMAARHSLLTERRPIVSAIEFLNGAGIIEDEEESELQDLRQVRNDVVHGQVDPETVITVQMIERLRHYAHHFRPNDEVQPPTPPL